MSELVDWLVPKKLRVNRLFLDPNNPRLFGLPGERRASVPENRIAEPGVQESVLQTTMREFNVKPLRDSIFRVGFLPIDRMIVRRISGTKNYVVIEGNRRLAAIKWLLRDHKRGETTLPAGRLDNLQRVNVLDYRGPTDRATIDRLILQGVRHISGVRDWGPYEKSEAVMAILDMGKSPREVGEILYLSTVMVNRFRRARLALDQMIEDDVFGEHANPDMFTHFAEIMARPSLRETWLGWDDDEGRFNNDENLHSFYSWITPSEDLGGTKKIPESINVRILPDILDDPEAKRVMMEPTKTIHDAHAIVLSRRLAPVTINFSQELKEIVEILNKLPVEVLTDQTDVQTLHEIQRLVNQRVEQASRLG